MQIRAKDTGGARGASFPLPTGDTFMMSSLATDNPTFAADITDVSHNAAKYNRSGARSKSKEQSKEWIGNRK